jgi:hypothetical protein
MDNPQTHVTLGTRHTKTNKTTTNRRSTTQKTKKVSNTNPPTNRR